MMPEMPKTTALSEFEFETLKIAETCFLTQRDNFSYLIKIECYGSIESLKQTVVFYLVLDLSVLYAHR
jgi:hypothetical protein